MDLKEDIAKLLAAGFSPARVADMLSIKVGLIEVLLKDTVFAERVRAGVTKKVIGGITRDDQIDSIQSKLLTEMQEKLEYGGAADASLTSLANMFRIVNSAKKVVEPGQQEAASAGAKIVNIVLPAYMKTYAKVEHEVNQNSEVISVDGRPMLTLSPHKLKEIAQLADADVTEAELIERKIVNNTDNRPTRLADLLIPAPTSADAELGTSSSLFAEAAAKRLAQLKAKKLVLGADKAEQQESSVGVGPALDLPPAAPATNVSVSVSGDAQNEQIKAQTWGDE